MCPNKGLRSDWTYRIRGVPLDWTETRLQSFLNAWDSSSKPLIKSLACELDVEFQTGTLIFQNPSDKHQEDEEGYISLTKPGEGHSTDLRMELDHTFVGITTLHVPEPENHKVDVIAISGLRGHAFGSFKAKGKEYMWLRDSLPSGLAIARIMLYDCGWEGSTSAETITDLAFWFRKDLLPLAGARRPILIIAHSSGGLIVKHAINSLAGSENEAENALFRAMRSLVFFGVPHRGMDTRLLSSMVGDGQGRRLIQSLEFGRSEVLENMDRDFYKVLDNNSEVEILSFYETEESPIPMAQDNEEEWVMIGPKAIIVPEWSATHGHLSKNHWSFHRTHSDLVKFSRDDQDYSVVCKKLHGLVRRFPEISKGSNIFEGQLHIIWGPNEWFKCIGTRE